MTGQIEKFNIKWGTIVPADPLHQGPLVAGDMVCRSNASVLLEGCSRMIGIIISIDGDIIEVLWEKAPSSYIGSGTLQPSWPINVGGTPYSCYGTASMPSDLLADDLAQYFSMYPSGSYGF